VAVAASAPATTATTMTRAAARRLRRIWTTPSR
jgi:hypothetical protein